MKTYTITYYKKDSASSMLIESDNILNAMLKFIDEGYKFEDILSISFLGNAKSEDDDNKPAKFQLFK